MASAAQIDLLRQILQYWMLNDTPIPIEEILPLGGLEEFENEIRLLEISELIQNNESSIGITPIGRSKFRIVLTGGAYDLLHKGHLITLKEAAKLGDFLVVVVAHDQTVRRKKREPIQSAVDRAYLLNELKMVDAAILGDRDDHMRVVRRIKPDIVAIGSDQNHLEEVLGSQLKDAGMENTEIIRMSADYENLATSRLIDEILKRHSLNEL